MRQDRGVTGALPDLDWYLDHVVVPGGPDHASVGPIRAWQAAWTARAWELAARSAPALSQAVGQGFVLTRRQARAAGVSDAEQRRLVRNGTWSTPRYGVLAVVAVADDTQPAGGVTAPAGGAVPDHTAAGDDTRLALAATAAALVRPGQVISHRSAAVVHGLPLLTRPKTPELTGCPRSTLGQRSEVVVRSAALRPDEVTTWFGAPVTTVARTVVDVARGDRRAGLVAADAARHERLVTADELAAAVRGCTGWPGARAAREIGVLASPLAESPLESLTRLCVLDAELPAPELQVRITDPGDGWSCRVDMLWRAPRVVLEADGRLKYTGAELWREKRRQLRLERLGYRVVRAIWSDVTQRPDELLEQLRTYLRAPASAASPLS